MVQPKVPSDTLLNALRGLRTGSMKSNNLPRHVPIVSIFSRTPELGHWIGPFEIKTTWDEGYYLAEVSLLEIYTFGRTLDLALLRVVEHATTYYDHLAQRSSLLPQERSRFENLSLALAHLENQLFSQPLSSPFIRVSESFSSQVPADASSLGVDQDQHGTFRNLILSYA
jgi:predicted RNase H-like HicB family nuclease